MLERKWENMAKHCLLMLTDSFPFDRGETYIEQEIEFVAAAFDQVVIIPMRSFQGAQRTRLVPPNVRLLPAPAPRGDWRWWTVKWGLRVLTGGCSPTVPRMVGHWPWRGKDELHRFLIDLRFAATVYEKYEATRQVISEVDFSQFDSVVIYSYWFYQGVGVADLLRRRELGAVPVQVVARAHRYDVDEEATPRKYLASRPYLLKAVDKVYPISQFASQFLSAYCPDAPGRADVDSTTQAPTPTTTNSTTRAYVGGSTKTSSSPYFHPPRQRKISADKIEVRRLGVLEVPTAPRRREDPLWVASCSYMNDNKRVELIVEAIGLLQARGIPVKWTHFGESDPERLASMQQLIETSCRQPEACELRGYVPNPEVRSFYGSNNVQVFVNCSLSEGVPVSIMEALACGIPCVATNAGGTSEIVHDQVNGYVLPTNLSAVDLADALQQVGSLSASEYAAMSQAARRTWAELICAPVQYQSMARELSERAKLAQPFRADAAN